jgi:UDP-N-acetylglucosamine 4-epimerase
MLVAATDAKVKRFVFAGELFYLWRFGWIAKIGGCDGKPLSPCTITKYVNELL